MRLPDRGAILPECAGDVKPSSHRRNAVPAHALALLRDSERDRRTAWHSGQRSRGPVQRTAIIFLHGNNDTPFPTACNPFGYIHDFAQFFADHGYSPSEIWGLGYQGDQCDLIASPTNRSGIAHSTIANVPDLRSFVNAVREYTGVRQVNIVAHARRSSRRGSRRARTS